MAARRVGPTGRLSHKRSAPDIHPMAVIDIGTTSVRMAIAQVGPDGTMHLLDRLQQAVSLGKDTFTTGTIEPNTIEECAQGLKSFCKVLEEYDIAPDSRHLRVVATSAFREARNREAALDRIYVATGLDVEIIDESEANRFTYLSIQPFLDIAPFAKASDVLIIEVGGGSTDLLALRSKRVLFAQEYPLGSLRMRQMLEDYRTPPAHQREVIENHIKRTVDRIRETPLRPGHTQVFVMGGEARFAASQLVPDWDKQVLLELSVSSLEVFTRSVLERSVDELVRMYGLTYPEAETLGSTLLTYVRLAQALKLKGLFITSITMRDGVLAEMAAQGAWTDEFVDQIVNSALTLGSRYHTDHAHAEHVEEICRQLFEALHDEHQLSPRHGLLLRIAALLHEAGMFVSNRSHHKHSMYLIANSELFGLGARDIRLTALVARYHRRATPEASHELYSSLEREERVTVAKLAAILRVADALDRSHAQRVRNLQIEMSDGQLVLTAPNVTDLTLEQLALQEKGQMFGQVYGLDVVLRKRNARG